jgi:hypothetical protein
MDVKSGLNSDTALYYSVKNVLSPLPKNLYIKIYKDTTEHTVLYGRETRCLALSVEHKLGCVSEQNVEENRLFESRRKEVTQRWRELHSE